MTVVDERFEICAERLFADLSRRCGFRRDELLMRKLMASVSRFSAAEAIDWVERITALPGDDIEWLALVEGVTVHETYFFREPAHYKLISKRLIPEPGVNWVEGCGEENQSFRVDPLILVPSLPARYSHLAPQTPEHVHEPRIKVLAKASCRHLLFQNL